MKQKLVMQINPAQGFHWSLQILCTALGHFQWNEVSTFFPNHFFTQPGIHFIWSKSISSKLIWSNKKVCIISSKFVTCFSKNLKGVLEILIYENSFDPNPKSQISWTIWGYIKFWILVSYMIHRWNLVLLRIVQILKWILIF